MTKTSAMPDAVSEALLGEIAEEFTQQMVQGHRPRIEDYTAKHPDYADVLRQVLPALQAVHASGSSASGSRLSAEREPVGGVLGDFKILGEIGRGGMGVVYECEQISLQRRVALKVLPMASVLDDRRLQRFRNEALAAAQLDHPHIVDVLGVGSDRGVHYYAMRYIEGQTVAEYIETLRAERSDGRPASTVSINAHNATAETRANAGLSTDGPSPAPESYRRLAEMFARVASALDHAHQQGIVHRDVKPSNIIVDAAGKPWICDFGLAQIDNGAAGLTRTGDLVGTLRFLSPEQVTVKHLVIDGRIDVYALGATLYEVLTLEPAFEADDRAELLQRIATVEPRPPRKIDARIPAELETIVLKAMAKNPHERYATAGELADDLQRFASDEPIRARRPGLAQRLSRWSRRHRLLVRAAMVVAVLAGIGFGIASFAIDVARRDAVDAKNLATAEAERANRERLKAERLRDREERNFRQAMKAVDLMLTRVGQHKLVNAPHLVDVRRELLEKALEIYRAFLKQRDDDPRVALETVKAHVRVGEILLMLGRWDDARHAYDASLLLAEQGTRQPGADKAAFDAQRSVARHNLGVIAFAQGNAGDAETSYRMSLAIGEGMPKFRRDASIVRANRPASHNNLGNVLYQRGELKSAAEHYRKAIQGFDELAREFPDDPTHRNGLATAHCSLARYLSTTGKTADADRNYAKARDLQRGLVARYPGVPKYRRELARTLGSLADVRQRLQQYDSSRRLFLEAIALQAKLSNAYAKVPDFQKEVARVHNTYSFLLRKLGELNPAIEHCQRALKIRSRLALDHPKVPRYRVNAARNQRHLAVLLAKSKPDAARELHAKSIATLHDLANKHPNVRSFAAELAESHYELGRFQVKNKAPDAAEKSFATSIALFRKLTAHARTFPRYRSLQVKARWHLAMIFAGRRESQTAAKMYAANVAELRKLIADFPTVPAHRRDLAGCLYNLGLMRLRLREFEKADKALRENLRLYAALMKARSDESRYRLRLRKTLTLWGGMLHFKRRRATDGVECLALSAAAWSKRRERLSRRWFDRAATMSTTDRTVYLRLRHETALLTGFPSGTAKPPVIAPKPTGTRTR